VRRVPPPPSNRAASVLAALTLAGLGAVGCAPHVRPPPAVPASDAELKMRFFPPPFPVLAPEDAIVRVVGPQMNCSGTRIDDDLVLTAHHCVVVRSAGGDYTKELVPAKDLRVELGGDYFAMAVEGVSAVVAPPCGESGGGGDVAVLVLKRKVVDFPVFTPRLEGPPRIGEEAEPAGFGRCAISSDGLRRNSRPGGSIMATTAETIHLRASICPGDSGGPLIARSDGAVLGVISMSAMDGDDRTSGASVVARIDSFRSVLAYARLVADGTSPSELPPLSCAR
jgi:Trypsin